MKYRILLSMVAMLFAITVSAQETKEYPHAFIGLQGGMMKTYNGQNIDRKWNPMAAISLGYNFTDVFGLRLQANGSSWKATLADDSEYKSKIGNIDLDMMFNLSNVFFPNQKNFVNVIAIAGVPFELALPHAWIDNYAYATADGGDRWNPAWKVGGMLDFNLSKHWGINLEAGTNYVRQKNGLTTDNNKWWPYAMAGLTFKFGHKKVKQVAPIVEQPIAEVDETNKTEVAPAKPTVVESKPEPKPEPKPVVKQPVKITENIFFDLAKSNIKSEQTGKIDQIVKWANENPKATILLTGYADKETGNARINKKIAADRADNVKKALVAKGVAVDRLKIDVKGDTEQPFANNDENRVVIAFGEE
jgi:OOP family OmpA-OmpF porin